MPQIRPSQIIPTSAKRINPYSSLPRDLSIVGLTLNDVLSTGTEVTSNSPTVVTDDTLVNLSPGSTGNATESQAPHTPAILGIESQTVTFQPDGTAKVDVVLILEDIDGVVEYDIRVAKDSGNL